MVSLPIRELANTELPGSVFGIEDLADAKISSDLRSAVSLVDTACRHRKLPIVFLSRPEIFTNTASLTWLQQQLGEASDHLCISDGMSVRTVPAMRNHMFLYRLGIQANLDAFTTLLRRAPELISTMRGQINTAFGVKLGIKHIDLPTVVLPGCDTGSRLVPYLYPFFLNKSSAQRSAERSIIHGAMENFDLFGFTRIVYVPLSEVAAHDHMFAEVIGALLIQAYFDPSICVILRMPFLASSSATLAERIAAGLAGLCGAHVTIPRIMATNILFSTDDLDETLLLESNTVAECIAHESFDFWRHSPDFYAACKRVIVYVPARRRRDRAGIRSLLRHLLGRDPTLRWLPFEDPNEP